MKLIVMYFLIQFFSSCVHETGTLMTNEVQATNEIETKTLNYKSGDKTMSGYLAMPKNLSKATPGVLVVHEWWGQNEYPRNRARMLAKQGYVALAVDMYGNGKVADHPKKAGEFSSAVMGNAKTAAVPFDAAMTALKSIEQVDPDRIAAMGYCFGGSVVLEMARQNKDLSVVASYHGGLMTPSKASPGKVKADVLVFNGAADPFVKKEQIESFKKEMDAAKVTYTFKNYDGAVHGFTNPGATENGKKFSLPLAFDPVADRDSWNLTIDYFQKHL